jgi:hypothetical protein
MKMIGNWTLTFTLLITLHVGDLGHPGHQKFVQLRVGGGRGVSIVEDQWSVQVETFLDICRSLDHDCPHGTGYGYLTLHKKKNEHHQSVLLPVKRFLHQDLFTTLFP